MSCDNNNTPIEPIDLCHECEEQASCCEGPDYDDDGCLESVNDKCVIYGGLDVPCTDIKKGNTIRDVIVKLANMIKGVWSKITSDSLVITPKIVNGCTDGVSIEVVPSTDANNIFKLGTDGKPYVPSPTGINILNTKCLSWNRTIVNGTVTFSPTIDFDCFTTLICKNCANTAPAITCTAPAALAVSQVLQSDGTTIATVTWTSVGGVVYKLFLNGVQQGTVSTPYVHTGLVAATTYTFLLEATCTNGAKSYSAITFTTASLTNCTSPTNLNIIMN